jgi:peptidoglycan biosynthesis protein MviN/MurJ (putative lipid II flippase)
MNGVGISGEKNQTVVFSKFFSAGSVIFFVALGQVMNIIQEMLIAAYFGTTWVTDAYKLSMAIPTLFATESIGIINAIVIPILYTGKTFEEQRKIFSALLMFFILASISFWIVLLLCVSPLIAVVGRRQHSWFSRCYRRMREMFSTAGMSSACRHFRKLSCL